MGEFFFFSNTFLTNSNLFELIHKLDCMFKNLNLQDLFVPLTPFKNCRYNKLQFRLDYTDGRIRFRIKNSTMNKIAILGLKAQKALLLVVQTHPSLH